MYHIKLSGNHYQMGYKIGSRIYKNGFRLPEQDQQSIDFGMKCEKTVKEIFPEILDELKGYADGCHAPYEKAAAFILNIGAFSMDVPNCSVFAVKNNDDVIFGRNYDSLTAYKNTSISTFTYPENGYRHIGEGDMLIGRGNGINDRGLAVGSSSVFIKKTKPGINFSIATRYLLEKCADVNEGIEALLKMKHSIADNFLLADKSGDMAVVEISPERYRIRKPVKGEDFILCTNHFTHPEMLEMEDIELRNSLSLRTFERYDAIHAFIRKNRKNMNIEKAQNILSDHNGYVCCHYKGFPMSTLWSVAASLKGQCITRAEGSPCRAKYRIDSRLN